jgi:hypothetical protein
MGGFRHPRGRAWEGLSIAPKGSRAYVVDELLVDADELMKAPTRTCALGACVAAHANVCARACVRAHALVCVCACVVTIVGVRSSAYICASVARHSPAMYHHKLRPQQRWYGRAGAHTVV